RDGCVGRPDGDRAVGVLRDLEAVAGPLAVPREVADVVEDRLRRRVDRRVCLVTFHGTPPSHRVELGRAYPKRTRASSTGTGPAIRPRRRSTRSPQVRSSRLDARSISRISARSAADLLSWSRPRSTSPSQGIRHTSTTGSPSFTRVARTAGLRRVTIRRT